MTVTRRKLLTGGLLGVAGVGTIGIFSSNSLYRSNLQVANLQSQSVQIDLSLSNLDKSKTVLDHSVTLAPDEEFRREGMLANDTNYRLYAETNQDSVTKPFETCCRGYSIRVLVEQNEIQVLPHHYD